jgi:hypothetical protein
MTLARAGRLSKTGNAVRTNQILREIDWFVRSHRTRPAMYVAFDRLALSG